MPNFNLTWAEGGGGGGGDDLCVGVLSIYVCEYVHVWVFLYGGIVCQISMCYLLLHFICSPVTGLL